MTPDHPRRDPLWALNGAWNTDKHRDLSVVYFVPHSVEVRPRPFLSGGSVIYAEGRGPMKQGTEVARFTAPCELPATEVRVDADIGMEIGFDTGVKTPFVPLQIGIAAMRVEGGLGLPRFLGGVCVRIARRRLGPTGTG